MERIKSRISINKLAEYMVATPGRRRTIVKNQKKPADFIVAYYNEAEEIISKFIANEITEKQLWKEIAELERRPVSTDWDETRQSVCIAALDEFENLITDVELPQYDKVRGDRSQERLIISGIQISVRPEILLFRDGNVVGAIKMVFNKTRTRGKDEIEYIGTVLLEYMREIYDKNINNTDCYVIDIFAGKMDVAPKAFKKRMKDIEASCEEIRDTWKRV